MCLGAYVRRNHELEATLRNGLLDAFAVRCVAGRIAAQLTVVLETAHLVDGSPGVLFGAAEAVVHVVIFLVAGGGGGGGFRTVESWIK